MEHLTPRVQVEAVARVVAVVADMALTVVRGTRRLQVQVKETTAAMVLLIPAPATLVAVAAVLTQSGQTQLAQLAEMVEQVQHLQLRERL